VVSPPPQSLWGMVAVFAPSGPAPSLNRAGGFRSTQGGSTPGERPPTLRLPSQRRSEGVGPRRRTWAGSCRVRLTVSYGLTRPPGGLATVLGVSSSFPWSLVGRFQVRTVVVGGGGIEPPCAGRRPISHHDQGESNPTTDHPRAGNRTRIRYRSTRVGGPVRDHRTPGLGKERTPGVEPSPQGPTSLSTERSGPAGPEIRTRCRGTRAGR
jgi:hypothetical protein